MSEPQAKPVETEAQAESVAREELTARGISHESLDASIKLVACEWVVWLSPAPPTRGGGYKVIIDSRSGVILNLVRGQ
jgi:hypothetical protein